MEEYPEMKLNEKFLSSRDTLEACLTSSGGGSLLSGTRLKILNLRPCILLQELREGRIGVLQTLEAFQAKAIEQSKKTNCVTHFVQSARVLAEELDCTLRADIDLREKPLFGLPISVKENISIKGTDSTLGLKKFVDKPLDEDAALVHALKSLGAIPFVKTNLSQLCFSFGCANFLFGETGNPHDNERTCGGSSGGEGALIAGGGSVLGLGADIGGSARIPGNFCGTFVLKPTARRVPQQGTAGVIPGMVGVYGTIGLMASDAELLAEATKVLLSTNLNIYDANIPPITWKSPLKPSNVLKIGWYDSLEIFPSTPGVRRAVAEAVKILQNLGHNMVKVPAPDGFTALKLWTDILFADNGAFCEGLLEGEKVHHSFHWFRTLASVPARLREVAKPYVRHTLGNLSTKLICDVETPGDLWKRLADRSDFFTDFVNSFKTKELDLILGPVMPMPAPPKGFDSRILVTSVYTRIYNILDLPCCVVSVTTENEEDQKQLRNYPENDDLLKLVKQYTKGSTGMPIGVQFAALPFQEELLCRIMKEFAAAQK